MGVCGVCGVKPRSHFCSAARSGSYGRGCRCHDRNKRAPLRGGASVCACVEGVCEGSVRGGARGSERGGGVQRCVWRV